MARTLISVPAAARRGEIIEIKVLIAHVMETGYRPGADGKIVPRDIITLFVCRYEDEEVFRAELSPATSANPFVSFSTVATETGTLSFTWTGDRGFAQTETAQITVT